MLVANADTISTIYFERFRQTAFISERESEKELRVLSSFQVPWILKGGWNSLMVDDSYDRRCIVSWKPPAIALTLTLSLILS